MIHIYKSSFPSVGEQTAISPRLIIDRNMPNLPDVLLREGESATILISRSFGVITVTIDLNDIKV